MPSQAEQKAPVASLTQAEPILARSILAALSESFENKDHKYPLANSHLTYLTHDNDMSIHPQPNPTTYIYIYIYIYT